jgi:ankyrin repeat protein
LDALILKQKIKLLGGNTMKFPIRIGLWSLSFLLSFVDSSFAQDTAIPSNEIDDQKKLLNILDEFNAKKANPNISSDESKNIQDPINTPSDEINNSKDPTNLASDEVQNTQDPINTPLDEIKDTSTNISASEYINKKELDSKRDHNRYSPEGWSFDIGGQYTWMSFLTPPTYKGSSGGGEGKITYQEPKDFFGQLRSVYNKAPSLSSPFNSLTVSEWYSEFVGGYSFSASDHWSITPYAGIGFDFLNDYHTNLCYIPEIQVKYRIFYALIGLETHYTWKNWMVGLQVDCFPTFNQYLKIIGLPGAAWTLQQRVGFDVRVPATYRLTKNIWLEFAPYYRLLPIGASHVLGLPKRNLNQWGAFLALRFFKDDEKKRSRSAIGMKSNSPTIGYNLPINAPEPDIVDILIKYGNNPLKVPAISYATYLGEEQVVSLLLKHGANVNQISSISTPLEIALKRNHLKLAALLINNKALVTVEAASICCEHHLINEFQTLIKANKEIIKSEEIVTTCCETAFLEGLELLFENGASIPKDFTDDQILYNLLSKGDPNYIPIVKFMITKGADCSYTKNVTYSINQGKAKWTAVCSVGLLVPALDFNDHELISLLIKNKAHLNTSIKNGNIAADIKTGAYFNNNKQRKQILCLDPLYKAVFEGKFDIASLLIASGSQRNSWLDIGFNHAAIVGTKESNIDLQVTGYLPKIKKFYEFGFLNEEIYFSNMMQWTIKEKADVRWVKFLFELGAQPKNTYLEWAIEKKNKDIIKALIERGTPL